MTLEELKKYEFVAGYKANYSASIQHYYFIRSINSFNIDYIEITYHEISNFLSLNEFQYEHHGRATLNPSDLLYNDISLDNLLGDDIIDIGNYLKYNNKINIFNDSSVENFYTTLVEKLKIFLRKEKIKNILISCK